MGLLILYGAIIVLLVGLGAKYYLDATNHDKKLTNKEFLYLTGGMMVVFVPLFVWGMSELAIQSAITYHENLGGFETKADWDVTTCTRDGACFHHYDCDPYKVVDQEAYTDKDGKHHDEESHTAYHDCPYTTEEWTFTVDSTVGPFTIAPHNLPTNPNEHRYRWGTYVPSYIDSGVPDFWSQVKARLDVDQPGPVTARHSYDNYILASQTTSLKNHSNAIESYKKAGLLPAINSNIVPFYWLNRVYFVGASGSGDWGDASNRFDAAFGSQLQGDLHVVIVNANTVTNPDEYALALLSYWQSDAFGRDALSKNGVILVLGTKDNKTISWARASTGMPIGNEGLMLDLQNELKGKPLDADALFGNPKATLNSTGVNITIGDGILQSILWGPHKFQREHMGGKDSNGKSQGFAYLLREIQPTTTEYVLILLGILLASCIAWGIAIYHPVARTALSRVTYRG
jgi:hypothetical protein